MDHSRTIRIPVYMCVQINKMRRVIGQLEIHLQRELSSEEIRAEMILLTSKVLEILPLIHKEVLLDTPIGPSQDSVLGDFIVDDMDVSPDEKVINNLMKEDISEVLNSYTERERDVINKRFGLQYQAATTLEEIGKINDVT